MFSGCTSLTKAPELPATTLETACYQNMFLDCSKLNYIKVGKDGKQLTSWKIGFLKQKITDCLKDSTKDFLGYHLAEILAYDDEITDIITKDNAEASQPKKPEIVNNNDK